VITVLLWWASRHCVASAATGWRYVTWEEMTAAEAAIRGGSDEALGAGPEKVLDGRYAS
jgi:hypothetical protein